MSDEGAACEWCSQPKPKRNGRYCSRQCMWSHSKSAQAIWSAYLGRYVSVGEARALDRAMPDELPPVGITDQGEACISNARGALVPVDVQWIDDLVRQYGPVIVQTLALHGGDLAALGADLVGRAQDQAVSDGGLEVAWCCGCGRWYWADREVAASYESPSGCPGCGILYRAWWDWQGEAVKAAADAGTVTGFAGDLPGVDRAY